MRMVADERDPVPLKELPLLEVSSDGTWFRLAADGDSGAVVCLRNRVAIPRLLLLLAQQRLMAPGRVCTVFELLESGWPRDEVDPLRGAARVYQAMAAHRRLGLRPVAA